MTLETNTSKALKYSVYIAMAVLIVGLILHFADITDNVLWFGILLLIISPLIGVIVTTVSLYLEHDMKWVYVALILMAISAVGMIV